MSNINHRISKLGLLSVALLGLGLNACISDDKDDDKNDAKAGTSTGGSGSAGTPSGGSSGGGDTSMAGKGGGTTGPAGTACASPLKLAAGKGAITDFDDYDGSTMLNKWSFALGADSSIGVFAGPFGYGDDEGGAPEKFEMVEGNESTYALSISDTMAEEYGGGMGLWLSACLDATAFEGISFWVRGNAPSGTAKLTLLMQETTPTVPATADGKKGTCEGTDKECLHPTADVTVTDTWAEAKVPWADFKQGSNNGEPVAVDGHNVWQVQFDVGLVWVADEADPEKYNPTPAPYELALDSVAFY